MYNNFPNPYIDFLIYLKQNGLSINPDYYEITAWDLDPLVIYFKERRESSYDRIYKNTKDIFILMTVVLGIAKNEN